jgi:hypothetical protein
MGPVGICLHSKNHHLGIFGGPWNINLSIFYSHLMYFTAIWYILWPFGVFYCRLEYFLRFGLLYQENVASLV